MSAVLPPITRVDPLAPFRRTVDTLWACLAPEGRPKGLRRILFTAAGGGQGTTTLAACAAVGLTRHLNAKVTLVEVGSPSAMLSTLLAIEPRPGLSEVLADEAEREQATHHVQVAGLRAVPGGGRAYTPGAFATDRARAFLEWLELDQDFLLIDAPPVRAVPEARLLLSAADEVVVVVEAGRTRKDEAKALLRALKETRLEILGCILNGHRRDLPVWFGDSQVS